MTDRDPLSAEIDDAEFEKALQAVAGTLTPEEGERRIQDIYRWRDEASRPMHMITPSRAADDPVWAVLTPERIIAVTQAIFGASETDTSQQDVEPRENDRA